MYKFDIHNIKIPDTDNFNDKAILRQYYNTYYYGVLISIINGIFIFENIDQQKERVLKKILLKSYYYGAKYDDNFGMVFGIVAPTGTPNIIDEYSSYEFYYPNGESEHFSINDNNYVIGKRTNVYSLPDIYTCSLYSTKLADLEITERNDIILNRHMGLYVGSENDITEALNVYDNLEVGVPFMVANEDISESMKLLQYNTNSNTQEYNEQFTNIFNRFLLTMGLKSFLTNKKERLITNEAEIYDNVQSCILTDRFTNLYNFIEECNTRFGTNVKVKINPIIDIAEYTNANTVAEESDTNEVIND